MSVMAPQDILRHLKRTPFRPFRLFVSDGATFDVPDPFIVQIELTQVAVGVDFDDETGLPRKSVYLAPNHVTRVEPLDDTPAVEDASSRGAGQS